MHNWIINSFPSEQFMFKFLKRVELIIYQGKNKTKLFLWSKVEQIAYLSTYWLTQRWKRVTMKSTWFTVNSYSPPFQCIIVLAYTELVTSQRKCFIWSNLSWKGEYSHVFILFCKLVEEPITACKTGYSLVWYRLIPVICNCASQHHHINCSQLYLTYVFHNSKLFTTSEHTQFPQHTHAARTFQNSIITSTTQAFIVIMFSIFGKSILHYCTKSIPPLLVWSILFSRSDSQWCH